MLAQLEIQVVVMGCEQADNVLLTLIHSVGGEMVSKEVCRWIARNYSGC